MPTAMERRAAIEALGSLIGDGWAETLDELVPSEAWIETLDPRVMRHPQFMERYADRRRWRLWDALQDLVGEEHAGTLMEFLLPVPYAVLAEVERQVAAA